MYKLWNMLAEMKSDAYEWVELSHSMNNDSPVWSGIPAGSVEVSKTVFDWGNPMLECLIRPSNFPANTARILTFPVILLRICLYPRNSVRSRCCFPCA